MRTIQLTVLDIHFLSKWVRCFSLGSGIKLYRLGMIKIESTNMAMILIDAMIPNSFSS